MIQPTARSTGDSSTFIASNNFTAKTPFSMSTMSMKTPASEQPTVHASQLPPSQQISESEWQSSSPFVPETEYVDETERQSIVEETERQSIVEETERQSLVEETERCHDTQTHSMLGSIPHSTSDPFRNLLLGLTPQKKPDDTPSSLKLSQRSSRASTQRSNGGGLFSPELKKTQSSGVSEMPGTVDIDRVFRKAVGKGGKGEEVNKRLSYSIDEFEGGVKETPPSSFTDSQKSNSQKSNSQDNSSETTVHRDSPKTNSSNSTRPKGRSSTNSSSVPRSRNLNSVFSENSENTPSQPSHPPLPPPSTKPPPLPVPPTTKIICYAPGTLPPTSPPPNTLPVTRLIKHSSRTVDALIIPAEKVRGRVVCERSWEFLVALICGVEVRGEGEERVEKDREGGGGRSVREFFKDVRLGKRPPLFSKYAIKASCECETPPSTYTPLTNSMVVTLLKCGGAHMGPGCWFSRSKTRVLVVGEETEDEEVFKTINQMIQDEQVDDEVEFDWGSSKEKDDVYATVVRVRWLCDSLADGEVKDFEGYEVGAFFVNKTQRTPSSSRKRRRSRH
ncbi:hypothetical protein TrVE_jg13367 [Triparma verrucosa]|uniref:Uncharacterized protein n=1 Tax=Triparma verrucosa TaxID=1606542 RepID=A0A9W7C888_9STRA|nr:hypothetical protein TrVE_jg13367 [Triparma verrucosa]